MARRQMHKVLEGKLEEKEPPGSPRSRWKKNITEIDLKDKIGGCGLKLSGSG
jgi:hypothetical protein